MSWLGVLGVLACVGTVAGTAAGTAAAAPRGVTPSVSSNWAGYAISDSATIDGGTPAKPLAFSDVTASWVQPKVRCIAGRAAYSAFWVGLGGFSTSATALEQIGTESDCSAAGLPTYSAWYEIVPGPSQQVDLAIRAGDHITTAVVVNGTDVTLQVKNRTLGTTFTRQLVVAHPDVSSAEWIAEAPSECSGRCHVLPLANFRSMAFTSIAATADGHPGTLFDPAWTALPIQLVPSSSYHSFFGGPDQASTAGATPVSSTPDGRRFAVSWLADAVTG